LHDGVEIAEIAGDSREVVGRTRSQVESGHVTPPAGGKVLCDVPPEEAAASGD
jgi:hypothetical protein